jgi:hypothetical protein
MVIKSDLRKAICSLFEVHDDESGVQRIVTPMEYPGTNDRIVIRVRPANGGFIIDENGEAAFFAGLSGGDTDIEAVARWLEELPNHSPARMNAEEVISAYLSDERLIAPYIFRVAEAAQQLHALATSRLERKESDFRDRVKDMVKEIAETLQIPWDSDVELPIAGGLRADNVLWTTNPLIVIAATSPTRLLEAEIIYMQYRAEKKPGYVMAVAESQEVVTKKQYERAGYYTDKAVIYSPDAFRQLVTATITSRLQ